MTHTEKLELNKPSSEDFVNVEDLNQNADKIDKAFVDLLKAVDEFKKTTNLRLEDIELLTGISVDGATAHNNIFRGKNLGDRITEEQYEKIQDGTFKDLYIGDYWIINGIKYIIVDFDYFSHDKHHLVLMGNKVYTESYMLSNFRIKPPHTRTIAFPIKTDNETIQAYAVSTVHVFCDYIRKALDAIKNALTIKDYLISLKLENYDPFKLGFILPELGLNSYADDMITSMSSSGIDVFLPTLSMISDYQYQYHENPNSNMGVTQLKNLYINNTNTAMFNKLSYFKHSSFDPFSENVNAHMDGTEGVSMADTSLRFDVNSNNLNCTLNMLTYHTRKKLRTGSKKVQPFVAESYFCKMLPLFVIG